MNDPSSHQLILGRYHKLRKLQNNKEFRKYLLKDLVGGQRAEIKTQLQGHPKPTVLHQAGFLQEMQGYPGFPLMIWSGNFNSKQMGLLTQTLGPSLQQLMALQPQKTFSLMTVCLIAIELIKIIELMHEKHQLVTDFRPQNFRLNPISVDKLVLSSLYNCKRYRSNKTYQHHKLRQIDYGQFLNHFVSFNRLINMSTSRRDDIQSFIYLIVFFIRGSLPWSEVSIKNTVAGQVDLYSFIAPLFQQANSKEEQELFRGIPKEFKDIFRHSSGLNHEEVPNYCYIRLKLSKLLSKLSTQQYPIPDWIKHLPNLRKMPLSAQDLNFQTHNQHKTLKTFYEPTSHRIQLDSINFTNGVIKTDSKSNGHFNKNKYKRRGTCVVM